MTPRVQSVETGTEVTEVTPLSSNVNDGSGKGPDHQCTVVKRKYYPLEVGALTCQRKVSFSSIFASVMAVSIIGTMVHLAKRKSTSKNVGVMDSIEPLGPYKLVERQEGKDFFDHYSFYDGPDSIGSAGFNTYVSEEKAQKLGIVNVSRDTTSSNDEEFIFMSSAPTKDGPRSSVRLEGKRRFDRGLFILDLKHMPAGCGVWPAFWMTDEDAWPNNGEIDIVEGINFQSVAKTALHTSNECNMFAHVPPYVKTGAWEWATGLPNTYTGKQDFKTVKETDDCWQYAPHQWFNQGCVAINSDNTTLGQPLNANGGGVYALEWDPSNKYIRSWVFSPHRTVPQNIIDAIQTSGKSEGDRVLPDTSQWGLPYAYFAIGEGTGCSADHFKNMRIVFNLAFCGTVSGNRYFEDCPVESKKFHVKNDPVASCNAWIQSQPDTLDEAYWKIKGLYVYEREMAIKEENYTGTAQ